MPTLVHINTWLAKHGPQFRAFVNKRRKKYHAKQTVTLAARTALRAFLNAYRNNSTIQCLDKNLVGNNHLPRYIGPHQASFRQLYDELVQCIEKGRWNLDVAVVELPLDHAVGLRTTYTLCEYTV
jgi:hypothetical protein